MMIQDMIDEGQQLIAAMLADGFDVQVAFWMKGTDEGAWSLYLASPFVDTHGRLASYRKLHEVMDRRSDLWLRTLDIRVLEVQDYLAKAAIDVIQAFAKRDPSGVLRYYPKVIWYSRSTFAGMDIDGAYIYPPRQPLASDGAIPL